MWQSKIINRMYYRVSTHYLHKVHQIGHVLWHFDAVHAIDWLRLFSHLGAFRIINYGPSYEPFGSNLRYQVRSVLSHLDASLIIMSCYLKCCFNIIRLFTPWSPSWLLPSRFCYCSFLCISDLSPAVPLSAPSSSFLTQWGRGHLNCLNAHSRGF